MQPALSFVLPPLLLALVHSAPAQGGWTNLGSGKPGTLGVPVLSATAPQLGKPLTLAVAAARPNTIAVFVIGRRTWNLPLWGGTLVPSAECVVFGQTDSRGTATLVIPLPGDRHLLAERPRVQCLILDPRATFGVAFTNALRGEFCQWFTIVEDFRSDLFLDKARSAGFWAGGTVTFGAIGGTGLHGDFDPTIGKDISDPRLPVRVYEWDLSRPGGFRIPKANTTTGKDELVTDGRFFFQTMEIPDGVEVHFVGSIPARITVQGSARIGGLLSANGESLPQAGRPGSELATKAKQALRGEIGGRGGAFGGVGGNGGDMGDGVSNKAAFNGKPGQGIRLMPRHFYAANYTGTGGAGSPQFPADGKNSSIVYSYFNVIAQHSNRGGGGGGFTTAGGLGSVKWSAPNAGNQRYASPGTTAGGKGAAFPPAFPRYTIPFTRQDHYLAGGSGGGGGGSCCGGAIKSVSSDRWRIGRAGGGGGGAIGLRLGGGLGILATGRIEARGGSAAFDNANFTTRGMMTPGGGGSGGALFLQVTGRTTNAGEISLAGGNGGVTVAQAVDPVYLGMRAVGGDGSSGILHFETAADPNTYRVGRTVPPNPPVSRFDAKDRDSRVSVRSLWYPANLLFKPEWLRYEIEVLVDGKPVTFSDDPRFGTLASGAASPVQFRVEGAELIIDATGRLVRNPASVTRPWADYVGPFGGAVPKLFGSGVNGYRFELGIDRSLGKTVVIKKVTVFWCL